MSQIRKQIVFNGRDDGVGSLMSRLRQSANELGRELLNEANTNSKTARDVVKYYEDQVRLLEKKNRLEYQSSKANIESQYRRYRDDDSLDQDKVKSEYKESIDQLNSDRREDDLQIELLRELIETTKLASKQEIDADKENSLREISAEEKRIGEAGPEFTSLAGRLRSQGGHKSDGELTGMYVQKSAEALEMIMNSQGGSGLLSGGLGMMGSLAKNPYILAATALIGAGTAGYKERASREIQSGTVAALSGRTADDIIAGDVGGTGVSKYGVRSLNVYRGDFLEKYLPSSIRAAGTSVGMESNAIRQIELDKAFALQTGTGDQLQKLTRSMEDVVDSQDLATQIYSSLYGTGALGANNTDMARMQDIMDGFIAFQEGQLMSTGSSDSQGTLGTLRMLQSMGGRFSRDDYSFNTMQSLSAGLSGGGTPEAEAIKFDVLRRLNPNKGFYELMMEKDKGINSEGFLAGVFDFVKSSGGDMNAQAMLMSQLTGNQVNRKDIWDLLQGNKTLDQIDSEISSKDVNIKRKALDASSSTEANNAWFKESFEDLKTTFGGKLKNMIDVMMQIQAGIPKTDNFK